MTQNHTDMTFLGWPADTRKDVVVPAEGKNRSRLKNIDKRIQSVKYQHMMIEDNPDNLPFAGNFVVERPKGFVPN